MKKAIYYILIALLLLTSAGCSGPSPDAAAKGFIDAMVKADFATAAKYVGGNVDEMINAPDAEEAEQLIKALFARVSYQIGDSKVTGNQATVAAKITAPDLTVVTAKVILEVMPAAFALAFSGGGSEEQMNTLFIESFVTNINDAEAAMLTSEVTINLEKKDGSWIITPDDAFINALTGNLGTAWAELGDQ